jgi:dipeptidyl-peptidase-4
MKICRSHIRAIAISILASSVMFETPAHAQGSKADYARSAGLAESFRNKVVSTMVRPEWLDADRFWYRTNLEDGKRAFWLVDASKGERSALFDHAKVAEQLTKQGGKDVSADRLPIERLDASEDGKSLMLLLRDDARLWSLELGTGVLSERPATEGTPFHLAAYKTPRPSRQGGRDTSITFINSTSESVKMFWIDLEGHRVPYNRLAPGETASQHTFSRHVWVAVGHNGQDLGVFVADPRPSIAVIDGVVSDDPPRRRRGDNPGEGNGDERGEGSWHGDDLPFVESARWAGETWERPWSDEAMSADVAEAANTATSKAEPAFDVSVREFNVFLKSKGTGEETQLTTDGTAADYYDGRLYWSPDAKRLVAIRTKRGGDRKVYYIESTPSDQLQPKLRNYDYLKPGDEIPMSRPRLFDMEARKEIAVSEELFPTPWSIDEMRWEADSSAFTFLYNQRGHTVMRVLSIDGASGAVRAIVNEECKTFFDYAAKTALYAVKPAKEGGATGEWIWMSERDGWNHLYLIDGATGTVKNQITKGEWVVRNIVKVDDEKRTLLLRVAGVDAKQDPYHIHFASVNFDGSGFTMLTDGDGTHEVVFSPGPASYFIDTYSRADLGPVTELRRTSDGKRLLELERADLSQLASAGWRAPERFVAKGRDQKTDIYGLIHRPTNFDANKKYPVVEIIYAGPHDHHVPKGFRSFSQAMEVAELGFIVMQIDGMGTNWRSKAFHDVAWKNLRDAGFPDRIAWMKSAAAKYPEIDLENGGRGVGIYGGSAGGQNSTAAVLWHGDFYKAAFSDCGCHDNRMDKIWWNELWMSWPLGAWYEENSNSVNAGLLPDDCKLTLTVGEMDENVDPASTMQVVTALQRANKDFELIVLPGMGHGAAESPYGKRRRVDFFVRSLMGKEPRWE